MIRVLIITDVRLYREGLTQLLGKVEQLGVVGTAARLEEALVAVRDLQPEVVLLDLAMPDGLAAVQALRCIEPDLRLVALSVPQVEGDVVACIEAGIAGYVTREAGAGELVAAIRSVSRGEFLCSPRVAELLRQRVAALAGSQGHTGAQPHLTTREVEILVLLERGFANKDIARHLGIEVATVKNHVHNILDKLGVHHRGEAVDRMRFTPRSMPGGNTSPSVTSEAK